MTTQEPLPPIELMLEEVRERAWTSLLAEGEYELPPDMMLRAGELLVRIYEALPSTTAARTHAREGALEEIAARAQADAMLRAQAAAAAAPPAAAAVAPPLPAALQATGAPPVGYAGPPCTAHGYRRIKPKDDGGWWCTAKVGRGQFCDGVDFYG